ncbi:LacI family DNA-binding transcriptional regulator [Microbispora sp. GKU 823]|uniref:LacI family DNA-binding transcriptional regulator n=1 Tax=Microbispora sp. GKU 823 TaxID=1652100 RepID=UPI00277B5B3B|nr:LacI family DNA-binding transcriptional regulator [Microbispora sp. GKU 823]
MTVVDEPSASVPEPLTLAQLAELAGVSKATVSKVVNGRSAVAPETRALIEGLIREHGFRRQRRRSSPAAVLELVFHELAGDYPTRSPGGWGRSRASTTWPWPSPSYRATTSPAPTGWRTCSAAVPPASSRSSPT